MLSDLFQTVQQSHDPNLFGPWGVVVASWGWAFLAALARLMGLLVLSPVFGQRSVSIWFRCGLAMCLATVVAPLLVSQGMAHVPLGVWDGGVRLVTEFVIGALLGLGVLFVFAGLKLAGELIDQQAGLAVQEVFDPSGPGSSTMSGQFLTLVGTLSLLCISPGNGHLQIVAALIDSFVTIPVSTVDLGEGAAVWISLLGQQSLALALQVAAPVLAAGAIVSWGIAALGGSGTNPASTTLLGLPLRIVISVFILAIGLTGMMEAFLVRLEDLLHAFPVVLTQG